MNKEKISKFIKPVSIIIIMITCLHIYFTNKVYVATVTNIHYPSKTDIEEVIEEAENSFKSYHYRNAIKKIHPYRTMPKKVNKIKATARFGSEVKGFKNGIVVDAKVWYCSKPEKII